MRIIVLCSALLLLGACKATRWPVSKMGASPEQTQRDIDECENRARSFMKGRAASGRDQSQAYNRLVIGCLRDRGYEVAGG